MKKKVFRERYAEEEKPEVLVEVFKDLIEEPKLEVKVEPKKRGRKKKSVE